MTQSIHNIHEAFHFEEIYDKLVKKFRHMSLFSVCLRFLRCQRSCEKKFGYCKMCSRVKENTFYDYNAFLSLKVSRKDNYLDIGSSERVDLDVFLNRPAYFPYCFCESTRSCTDHQVISFTQDLLVAFCSVLVRMYLNIATNHFSEIMSDLSLADEKKVVRKIFSSASLLLYKFFGLNCLFFMNFLTCLVRLMTVIVLIFIQASLNMVHIVAQNLSYKLLCFNFSCLVVICIDIA